MLGREGHQVFHQACRSYYFPTWQLPIAVLDLSLFQDPSSHQLCLVTKAVPLVTSFDGRTIAKWSKVSAHMVFA